MEEMGGGGGGGSVFRQIKMTRKVIFTCCVSPTNICVFVRARKKDFSLRS